jgi:hypothetical protein
MIPMTEDSPAGLTREQRIVDLLARRLPADAERLEGVEARSQALPALLRRHGPVQVILFLAAKGGAERNGGSGDRPNDRDLASWLVAGTGAALGRQEAATEDSQDLASYAEGLAGKDLPAYLLHWEIAVEVAGWIKMLIGARLETGKQPPTEAREGESIP